MYTENEFIIPDENDEGDCMPEEQAILVVDDEQVIRELMAEVLSDEGFRVESAPSGPVALEMMRERDQFVLLFTDIMMPEMNGIELIREARKLRPRIIPIVMTGFATLETARAAVREGAYDYVLKPFSLNDIKLAVANALERYNLASENARLLGLTNLFQFSESIASIREEDVLLDFVLKSALGHVDAARGSIMIATEDGQNLKLAVSVGAPPEHKTVAVPVGVGISGMVAQDGCALLVEDLETRPELTAKTHKRKDRSFISVPLELRNGNGHAESNNGLAQANVLAVLNVSEKKSAAKFNEGDLKTLSIMANHAAVALQNVRLIRDLEQAYLDTLITTARLLEAKDPYTHGHSARVQMYSIMLAQKLGLPETDIETMRVGAAFHDIGKVAVPDMVLNKTEALANDEWEVIKRHPLTGYEMLADIKFLTKEHLELVRSHHERLDGSGYPDGLAGDQLSTLVRIIMIVDAYDAMASNRAYRKAMPREKILAELNRCASCGQYDAEITRQFIELIEGDDLDWNEVSDEPVFNWVASA